MITKIQNNQGYVVGYLVYHQVNEEGILDDSGKYVYIEDMWVHQPSRHTKVMARLIDKAWGENWQKEDLEFVYYERSKYDHRKSKIYTIRQFLRFTKNL